MLTGLPALVAGCGGQVPSGPAVCAVTRLATLPVSFDRGYLLVDVLLNGQAARFLVDTGADGSLLVPRALVRLRLTEDAGRRATVQGTGGRIRTPMAMVRRFEVGGLESRDMGLVVSPLPGSEADGMLGADWLGDYDVAFDPDARHIELYRVSGCSGDFLPWPGRWIAVPMNRTSRGRPLIHVQIGSQRLRALIDSGANKTVMRLAAATRLGVTPEMLSADPAGQAQGVDLARSPTRLHRFEDVGIGTRRFRSLFMAVQDIAMPDADILLGLDFFRAHRIWLSHSTRQMFFQNTRDAASLV